MRDLSQTASMPAFHEVNSGADSLIPNDLREIAARSPYFLIAQEQEVVPISEPARYKIERLHGRVVDLDDPMKASELQALIVSLHDDVLMDLYDSWFLMIPAAQRRFYEQPEPPFGKMVEERYPDAGYDVAAATRCLAVDEWTACVST